MKFFLFSIIVISLVYSGFMLSVSHIQTNDVEDRSELIARIDAISTKALVCRRLSNYLAWNKMSAKDVSDLNTKSFLLFPFVYARGKNYCIKGRIAATDMGGRDTFECQQRLELVDELYPYCYLGIAKE